MERSFAAEVKQLALGGPSTSTGSAVPAAGVGCGGRPTIEDPGGIRRILTPGGLPSEPVPPALAQAPPECVTDPVAATGA